MNHSLIVLTTNAEEMIAPINIFHYVLHSNDASEQDSGSSMSEHFCWGWEGDQLFFLATLIIAITSGS